MGRRCIVGLCLIASLCLDLEPLIFLLICASCLSGLTAYARAAQDASVEQLEERQAAMVTQMKAEFPSYYERLDKEAEEERILEEKRAIEHAAHQAAEAVSRRHDSRASCTSLSLSASTTLLMHGGLHKAACFASGGFPSFLCLNCSRQHSGTRVLLQRAFSS